MKISNPCFPFTIPGDSEPLLFCFHHAGGNAGQLKRWAGIQDGIAVVPVEYAGHGCRMSEESNLHLQDIAIELAQAIHKESSCRTIYIYGHSLGSMIAFETVKCLETSGCQVGGLVVAGRGAPFEKDLSEFRSWMGRTALIQEMKRLGGMDAELLANEEFMDYFAPVIIKDYAMHESYGYEPARIKAPIIAHCAKRDGVTSPEQMNKWREVTEAGNFTFRLFEGGHFFVLESEHYLSELLLEIHKLETNNNKVEGII